MGCGASRAAAVAPSAAAGPPGVAPPAAAAPASPPLADGAVTAPAAPAAAAAGEAAPPAAPAPAPAPARAPTGAPASRRFSLAGGPAGGRGIISPTADAKRRRLSVAATPAAYSREVMAENAAAIAAVPADDERNAPVVASGVAAALPVRWGSYSRPGNDPLKRVKENQDACVVLDGYGGRPDAMFFAVFDGHGAAGGKASAFCRERVPLAWLDAGDVANGDAVSAIVVGTLAANADLHASKIDSYVSGSTAIMSLLRGRSLLVANVGDSRAVLGRATAAGGVAAAAAGGAPPPMRTLPLSVDQKPDRPDERARILACGGRVFEWGVPRVWLRDADMPGLAMSRSIGDLAAESVGVMAEPELAEVELGPADKFVIWASDGVWEFITSEQAVAIVAPYAAAGKGPVEAAAALVRESVVRWRHEEDVVDDSTAVVAFFDWSDAAPDATSESAGASASATSA